jgi:Zn-dependent protease with chaperone function
MLVDTCHTLDVPRVPELYIGAGGELNAFTAGVDHPIIVINAGAIDQLSDDELRFVLAHELGHVKSGHVLYYQIAEFLPMISEAIGDATFGVGALLGVGLQAALLNWRRKSEHTADRAGLLAVQDLQVALSTLMKLAGLPQRFRDEINVDDFVAQAREFDALDSDKLSWFAKWLAVAGQSHPWTVLRAKECLAWVDEGGYERVLAAPQEVPLLLPEGVARFCVHCGNGLAADAAFCTRCGKPAVVAS